MKVALTVALIVIVVVGIAVFAEDNVVNANNDWHESHHNGNGIMNMQNMMGGDIEEMHEQCESSMTGEAHEQCETMMKSGCPMMQ